MIINNKKQGEETAPGAAVFSPCLCGYALSGRLLVRLHNMALSLLDIRTKGFYFFGQFVCLQWCNCEQKTFDISQKF